VNDVRVLRFGGSSFATPADYREVASYLHARVRSGERLVVVVDGMAGATERLRRLALAVNPAASASALNNLLPMAGTAGAGLLRVALEAQYISARQLLAHGNGLTSEPPGGRAARLLGWDPAPVRAALANHPIVVLAGGQAADMDRRPAWLGENSADLSAVALAVALGLDECELYADRDGVYSADPRLVPDAVLLPEPRAADVVTMASRGARVPHPGAVELAAGHGVRLVCRLGRGHLGRGSVIARDGTPVHAVVADLRSAVVELGTPETAQRLYEELVEARLPAHLLRTPHGRWVVAVTGGQVDVAGFLARHRLPGRLTGERLVTEVRAGRVVSHLAADAVAARALATHLHRVLRLPGPSLAAA